MEQNPYREADRQTTSYESPFMEHENTLPCLQQSAIGPYPESDESTPQSHIQRPVSTLSSHLCSDVQSCFLQSGFLTNIL
jgi:hypothetical protein